MLLDAVVLTSLALAVVLGVFEPRPLRWWTRPAETFLVGFAIGAGAVGAALR